VARADLVGYCSVMTSYRARRWIAIIGFLVGGCRGEAAAPRAPAAAVAATSAPVAAGPAQPAQPAAEPVASSVIAAPPPEPATPPPPPCPSDQRDGEQMPDHVVQLVGLSDAMTVVDLGSGSGYFLCRLSRAVGPHGHVVATEVDKQLVRDLGKRIAREHLDNAEVVLAPTNDVGIAPGSADRILLVNVWHHLADRKRYAARIGRALAPGGKLVVVDFKPGGRHGSGHGIEPERALAELIAGGLDAALVSENLPDQYVIVAAARPGRAS
jgi:predicted methyltransferase